MDKDSIILRGDAATLLFGGRYATLNSEPSHLLISPSDTTAFVQTLVFYRLCAHPDHQSKIRAELATLETDVDTADLAHLSHLNAFIEETMRLHTPSPAYGERVTGPEGVTIGGRWIPPNTIIMPGRYMIARCKGVTP